MSLLPRAEGLYDPRHEHDACGVGFIANQHGARSHALVRKALEILINLEHRGACGCDPLTGDGAGILLQIPHGFFQAALRELGVALPDPGEYGVASLFLPRAPDQRKRCMEVLERAVAAQGQTLLGWRRVPTDHRHIGPQARTVEPEVWQLFVRRGPETKDADALERALYLIRRVAERAVAATQMPQRAFFYVCSFSGRTIVYKGLLLAEQIEKYYPDLAENAVESALAIVHQRFSTNTFPTWDLAHPFRYLCHNGEINTLRGNLNWMRARQTAMTSPLFGDDLKKCFPVIREGQSDSACLDNAFELLVLAGRSLAHAAMMLIPEAWSDDVRMDPARRGFYEYHACLQEPWDGPAAIAFTDGRAIGATLDRNGLRPARYFITQKGHVILASEVGVLDIPEEDIVSKGRLQPGRIFMVDTERKRIIGDEELKQQVCSRQPYAEWVRDNKIELAALPQPPGVTLEDHDTIVARQNAFGYTAENLRVIIAPMVENGEEPVGSMGVDTPLAVLSERPRLLYDYFKQLFAQVTNPPIDPVRESLVMSLEMYIGGEANLLAETPAHARQIDLPQPVLRNFELEALRHSHLPHYRPRTLSALMEREDGAPGLVSALDRLADEAGAAIREGCSLIVLTDRGVDERRAPIPALLAVAAVHHHLVRQELRTQAALVVESGEPREVNHFALLIAYGASAVNPYLAFETIADMHRARLFPEGMDLEQCLARYIKAVGKGLLKIMSKMGISTLQSYHGAEIYEAVGLADDVMARYFTTTASRIGGIGLDELAQEALERHSLAFPRLLGRRPGLDPGGEYQWRRDGEAHLKSPDAVALLQQAVRGGNGADFGRFSAHVNDPAAPPITLRALLDFREGVQPPAPLDEVEPAAEIVKRFATGAMSFGSISKEAHENLAIAMNRIGGRSNTGEGGEDPRRFTPDANGDRRRSAIKQVASARFGVTSEYLCDADELQIKMAQGAKPGEGGQLPGHKVDRFIAEVRHATPGVGLISPAPHHDIYSIEDLAQLIFDLKNANSRARISVKLVAEVGVGTVAAGVAKAHADVILISGHDGGTGASPLTSIRHAGVPWELGLAEAHQVLVRNDLRSRVVLQTDGQLLTGRDVAIACLLGAEEFGFATGALIASGCVMMRKCHLNTCPVGVATQDPVLRRRFAGRPEHVINFMVFLAEELRGIMARLGFRAVNEMVGRSDLLIHRPAASHWKAKGLDYSRVLFRPPVGPGVGAYRQVEQDHGLQHVLDHVLIERARAVIDGLEPRVEFDLPVRNANRAVGAMLGSEITRKQGARGLPDDSIVVNFTGSAGQSFGAFLPRGVTLRLFGDANDSFGKGLSGGWLCARPSPRSTLVAEESVIVGNVALYGATSGQAFIRGVAGERFAVRNSGAHAVVEGLGDHGCEYMTGGRVVVLGPTGRNFAAGMSGGVAYVHDPQGRFRALCNTEMVALEPLADDEDLQTLRALVQQHWSATASAPARRVLDRFDEAAREFVKVMPLDYRRVLEEARRATRADAADPPSAAGASPSTGGPEAAAAPDALLEVIDLGAPAAGSVSARGG